MTYTYDAANRPLSVVPSVAPGTGMAPLDNGIETTWDALSRPTSQRRAMIMILLVNGLRPIVLVIICVILSAAGCAREGQIDENRIFEIAVRSFARKGTPTVIDCKSTVPLFFEQQASSCAQSLECWQVSPEIEGRSMELMPTLRLGTWRSFVASNAVPHRLCDDWIPPAGVFLGAFPERQGEYLHLELSKVGFDEAGDQALIYVGLLEGQAGQGFMLLFEYRSGEWVEVDRLRVWIA